MLDETDVKDEHGNVVIQPGLKVRHKESQFEYTVEDVVQEPGGEVTVILKMPEEPRFVPPPQGDTVISDNKSQDKILYEVDPDAVYFEPEEDTVSSKFTEKLLAVPQSEFEKEYEVK